MSAPWITYRPELKVLDCTIRDGGLVNAHAFDDKVVRAVYDTCVEAGIDYMEIGYKGSQKLFAPDQFGDFKFCDEDHMRRIVGENESSLKLAAMADAEKTDYHEDILPRDKSVLDLIRVATYVHQLPVAVDMIKDAADKGYEVACNIMAVSIVQESEIDQALEVLAETPASTIVVVDSFGSLYGEQVARLVKKYLAALEGTGKEVGIHAHNNQQLAFANTIEAIVQGANRLDATVAGMGRGAGNCPMELLLGFLRNPAYRVRPVLQLLQDHFVELQESLKWGALVPYNITGQLNQHPRTAIAMVEDGESHDYVEFYDKIVADL
ncbi:MAG: aldolase catalytic domain-containing protein [Myxococcota bacterium]|nr:nucleoid-structuring protein H-NS [Spirochaeta sp.]RPG06049.1 MAG: nucleoid-structuring protein H-NS [Proteobacteria bacterium TMED72]